MQTNKNQMGLLCAAAVLATVPAAAQNAVGSAPAATGRATIRTSPAAAARTAPRGTTPVRSQTRATTALANPNLALMGVTQIGDRQSAWLVDMQTRQRLTVAPGATIQGYRVRRVEPELVVLSRGGRDYTLRLGATDILAPAAGPTAALAPTAAAAQTSGSLPRSTRLGVPAEQVAVPRDTPAAGEPFAQELTPRSQINEPLRRSTVSPLNTAVPDVYPGQLGYGPTGEPFYYNQPYVWVDPYSGAGYLAPTPYGPNLNGAPYFDWRLDSSYSPAWGAPGYLPPGVAFQDGYPYAADTLRQPTRGRNFNSLTTPRLVNPQTIRRRSGRY